MDHSAVFQQAILLAKTGERGRARRMLAQLVIQEPGHELAWLWLSDLMDSPDQRRYCLERALRINPGNRVVRHRLEAVCRLGSPPAAQPAGRLEQPGEINAPNALAVPAAPDVVAAGVIPSPPEKVAYEATALKPAVFHHRPAHRLQPRRLLAVAGLTALLVAVLFFVFNLVRALSPPAVIYTPAQLPDLPLAYALAPTSPPPTASPTWSPLETPTPTRPVSATDLYRTAFVNGVAILPEMAALLELTLTPTPRGDYTPQPHNVEYERGVTAYLQADYATALDLFARALAYTETLTNGATSTVSVSSESRGVIYYYYGLTLAALQQCDLAIAYFDQALASPARLAPALAERGLCWDALGQHAKAWNDYNAATRLSPDLITPYLKRAARYTAEENYERARAEYERALQAQPDHVEVLYQRAALSYHLGRNSRAMEDLNMALEINPKLAKGYLLRGQALANLLRFPEALYDLNVALALQPDSAEGWYQRGVVYQQLGEGSRALSDFNQALALRPEFPQALAGRGDVYLSQGEWTLARVNYNNALVYDEQLASAAVGLGRVTLALGSYDQAIENFSKALAAHPGDEDAMMYLGQALVLDGRYAEAVVTFNQSIRAMTSAPKQAVMYEWRGRAQHGLERYSSAIQDITLAIARYPSGARFYYRGLAYQAAGNRPAARADFERSLQSGELDLDMSRDAQEHLAEVQ